MSQLVEGQACEVPASSSFAPAEAWVRHLHHCSFQQHLTKRTFVSVSELEGAPGTW
jgi:hypothetical protein